MLTSLRKTTVTAISKISGGGKMLSLFYIIPPPLILLIAVTVVFLKDVNMYYWSALSAYFLLNVISFPVRKAGCGLCAMREICPGSAAKSN
jgi:hypothetical protein